MDGLTHVIELMGQDPRWMALANLCLGLLIALAVWAIIPLTAGVLFRRTKNTFDDLLAVELRLPVSVSVVAVAAWYGLKPVAMEPELRWAVGGVITSATVLIWSFKVARIGRAVLDLLVKHRERYQTVVTARTLPVFDISMRTVIYGVTAYGLLLAWDIDVSAWLASAGVIGVAVGFAAKDTLSNLISGVFILADAPYKLGDYLVLESGDRGEVVEIGIRTTRMKTRDDVEIIVPNAVMANARIVNQSGAGREAFRIRIPVSVAYGSDVDQVRAELIAIAEAEVYVISEPTPRVRFRRLGDSGLEFELMAWVERPALRGRATDALLTAIYKRFQALQIEIPYPKRHVILSREE